MLSVYDPNVARRDWEVVSATKWSAKLANIEYKYDTAAAFRRGVHTPAAQDLVRRGLSQLIRHSSRKQSVKGILTAGLAKSLEYADSKITKAWKK
jgi:translocator assembly and maintenance protein 41